MGRTMCYVSYSRLLIKYMFLRLLAQRNSASEYISKANVADHVTRYYLNLRLHSVQWCNKRLPIDWKRFLKRRPWTNPGIFLQELR
jgi:hypothetical protein